jgi:hypothetical protein
MFTIGDPTFLLVTSTVKYAMIMISLGDVIYEDNSLCRHAPRFQDGKQFR